MGFKVSHGKSLKSCYQIDGKNVYESSRVSVLLIQSMVSKLPLFLSHTRSKKSLRRGCINQRCDRENALALDLFYNDCDFFYIEICFIKIVMYLNDCQSVVDVG